MDTQPVTDEPEEQPSQADFTAKWLAKIDGSSKEEETWRKEVKRICNVYVPKNTQKASYYNILYGNVDIMLPVLYSNTPKPDVRRRFTENDPVAKFSSKLIERVLHYQWGEYDSDHEVELCVLDGLLTGRGVMRVRHIPRITKQVDEYGNEYEDVEGECAECEYVKWEDYRRSPGKTWRDVKWVAFKHYLREEEVEEQFPDFDADKLGYNVVANQPDSSNGGAKDYGQSKCAIIWEVWDKISNQIIYLAESYKDAPLSMLPPETKHRDFFPMPRPLQFIVRSDSLVPYPEYQEYREQAEQLVKVSKRIANITDALKVRGIYDVTMKELERLFDADDNDMLPAENVAAMYEKGGIEKMIWLLPLDKMAAALNYLYQQRESIKGVIYEISGISDILRGEGKASETLGAQQIKVQYANTRLKRRQKEVQRFVRDLFRLQAEVISQNFQPETIAKISNINPQELQQAQVTPEQILQVLHDNTTRDYRIDVQSDSMIALEDQDAQAQTSSFLQAINQFFAMITPLVQSGVMPIETAKAVIIQVSRKFKMGVEFESALEQLQPPPPPQPDPQVEVDKARVALEAKKVDANIAHQQQQTEIKQVQVTHDVVKSGVEAAHHAKEIKQGNLPSQRAAS